MTSLLVAYEKGCSDVDVSPNSALCHYFAATNAQEPMQVLSLATNLIGARGLQAVLPVWLLCRHSLHTLDLSYNNLDNGAVRQLAAWLLNASDDGFPALRRLELRGNPFTYQAGKCLVHCCDGLRPPRQTPAKAPHSEQDSPLMPGVRSGSVVASRRSTAASDGARVSAVPAYWEEVAGLQLAYIGVTDTLMSEALQRALSRRMTDAMARRDARRRGRAASSVQVPQTTSSLFPPAEGTAELRKGSEASVNHRLSGSHRGSADARDEAQDAHSSIDTAKPVEVAALPASTPADLFDELDNELPDHDSMQEVDEEGQEGEEIHRAAADEPLQHHNTTMGAPPLSERNSLKSGVEATSTAYVAVPQPPTARRSSLSDRKGSVTVPSTVVAGGVVNIVNTERASSSKRSSYSGIDNSADAYPSRFTNSVDVSRADTVHTALPPASPTGAPNVQAVEEESEESVFRSQNNDGGTGTGGQHGGSALYSVEAPAYTFQATDNDGAVPIPAAAATAGTVIFESEETDHTVYPSEDALYNGTLQRSSIPAEADVVITPPPQVEPSVRKTAFDILDELGLDAQTGTAAAATADADAAPPSWLDEM